MNYTTLEEVRETIDGLDTKIVKLLSERQQVLKDASKFKTSPEGVKAPKRVEAIIQRVRELAVEDGADPDIIENIYREMISQFTVMEMAEYEKRQ